MLPGGGCSPLLALCSGGEVALVPFCVRKRRQVKPTARYEVGLHIHVVEHDASVLQHSSMAQPAQAATSTHSVSKTAELQG